MIDKCFTCGRFATRHYEGHDYCDYHYNIAVDEDAARRRREDDERSSSFSIPMPVFDSSPSTPDSDSFSGGGGDFGGGGASGDF